MLYGIYVLMQKEETSKAIQTTKQSNTTHPRQSLFLRKLMTLCYMYTVGSPSAVSCLAPRLATMLFIWSIPAPPTYCCKDYVHAQSGNILCIVITTAHAHNMLQRITHPHGVYILIAAHNNIITEMKRIIIIYKAGII